MAAGGTFLVGQEQDILNGAFNENQAFSGNVTQIEMWKGVLSSQNILRISECEVESVAVNKVISWDNVGSEWSISGNVYLEDIPSSLMCEKNNPYHNKMLIMHKSSYDNVRLSCDQVGGQLPVINKNTLVPAEERKTNELMKNFTTEWEYNNCITENGLVNFWLGQYKDGTTGEWSSPYNPDEDFHQFKVPKINSNCAYVLGNQVFPEECVSSVACGVCILGEKNEIPKTVIKLKGICGEDLWRKKLYDLDYYVYGVKNGRPHFRCTYL